MKSEEATRLCIEALYFVRGEKHVGNKAWHGGLKGSRTLANALATGDFRIVSGVRLAALEGVARHADVAKSDMHDTCDDYIDTGDNRLACPFCQAVAELDVLDGGDGP